MSRCQICNCCPETQDPSEYWNGPTSGHAVDQRRINTNIDYTTKTYRGMGTGNFTVKYRKSVDKELCSRCWQSVKDNRSAYEWIDKNKEQAPPGANKELLIEPEELCEDALALSEV